VRLEGLGRFKNPMMSSEIETETFCLAAQGLNQLSYPVPLHAGTVPYETHEILHAHSLREIEQFGKAS
jgi:hypothetical protein